MIGGVFAQEFYPLPKEDMLDKLSWWDRILYNFYHPEEFTVVNDAQCDDNPWIYGYTNIVITETCPTQTPSGTLKQRKT